MAAAAAIAIIFAAGTAAITKSDGTAHAQAAPVEPHGRPGGADDWMYLQRANDDGSIPAAAVNEAIAQSKAAGQASKGSPSTDQVWTNLGPSNIGGRIRDMAADPSTRTSSTSPPAAGPLEVDRRRRDVRRAWDS